MYRRVDAVVKSVNICRAERSASHLIQIRRKEAHAHAGNTFNHV
jgi:hypothetical protein